MATGVPTVGRTTCRPILPLLYMAMLYCLRSSFGPQKNFESSTCTINNLSDNENINLKMPSMLWQGNLSNRASKIKRLLARHDIHLPRASGQVLSYTSDWYYLHWHRQIKIIFLPYDFKNSTTRITLAGKMYM